MKIKTFFDPIEVLERAGYKKHRNGMVKYVGKKGSRWHAIIEGNIIDVHYDKSQGHYHSAAPKKGEGGEIKRIKKADESFAKN